MIEAKDLTKRYGETLAVDDLSFTVHPGVVTGFLGPNGSGKSTTMRATMSPARRAGHDPTGSSLTGVFFGIPGALRAVCWSSAASSS
jgi:ABC-type glutathione transport system ATPase component